MIVWTDETEGSTWANLKHGLKRSLIVGVILGLLCAFGILKTAHAQNQPPPPATFTFNSTQAITSWNGSDPANPPYPQNMGGVSLNTAFGGGYGSSISVPFQLGFLNNGFLADCNPIVWGSKTYTIGDGTHTGDAFYVSGNTSCPYYTGEYGGAIPDNFLPQWSVTANYTIVNHTFCRYGRCTTIHTSVLQGGNGVVFETVVP